MEQFDPSVEQITSVNPLVASRQKSMSEFGQIEHRLEFVDEINGVEYVNDSKATDVNSTWYSLDCMEKPVIWILGLSENEEDYALFSEIATDKVKMIVSLGGDKAISSDIIKREFDGRVDKIVSAKDLEEAVALSTASASVGDVVLFSPACSNFDLFQNYKDRGQQFCKSVNKLRQ